MAMVDLESTLNQSKITKIDIIFTGQQGTSSFQVSIDYKLGDTGT